MMADIAKVLTAFSPRVRLRADGGGWWYDVIVDGATVASGWSAGFRKDAKLQAEARIVRWAATGSWSTEP